MEMFSSAYSWRAQGMQTCIMFCSRLSNLPPKKPACSSAGSVKMQKPLAKCHKTWKPTTARCPKDISVGTTAAVEAPAHHQSLDQFRTPCTPGHHQAFPSSGVQAWLGRFCSWSGPATPSPQKHDLPRAETGYDVIYSNAQYTVTSSFGPFVTF